MSDTIVLPAKKPAIVIIVSILQFLSAAGLFAGAAACIFVAIFGASLGLDKQIGEMMTQYNANPNISYGLAIFFGLAAVIAIITAILFLLLGIGLLKGSKVSWYVQIALSILGLIGFPIFTAINGVILFFFFRRDIRDFYRT